MVTRQDPPPHWPPGNDARVGTQFDARSEPCLPLSFFPLSVSCLELRTNTRPRLSLALGRLQRRSWGTRRIWRKQNPPADSRYPHRCARSRRQGGPTNFDRVVPGHTVHIAVSLGILVSQPDSGHPPRPRTKLGSGSEQRCMLLRFSSSTRLAESRESNGTSASDRLAGHCVPCDWTSARRNRHHIHTAQPKHSLHSERTLDARIVLVTTVILQHTTCYQMRGWSTCT